VRLRLVTAGAGAEWEPALVHAVLHVAPIFQYHE
jgi:hypothetical protein